MVLLHFQDVAVSIQCRLHESLKFSKNRRETEIVRLYEVLCRLHEPIAMTS